MSAPILKLNRICPNSLFKVIGLSVGWTSVTLFFGMLQIFILFIGSSIFKSQGHLLDLVTIQSGLLFFSIALLASIVIENLFSNKKRYNRMDVFLYYFSPFMLILICTIFATLTTLLPILKPEQNFSLLSSVPVALFTTAIAYAFFTKILFFCAIK